MLYPLKIFNVQNSDVIHTLNSFKSLESVLTGILGIIIGCVCVCACVVFSSSGT